MALLKDSGVSSDEIMAILLLTQWIDGQIAMAKGAEAVFFTPGSPGDLGALKDQIISALMVVRDGKREDKPTVSTT